MEIIWLCIGLVLFCFLAVAFRGAPYVPTHKAWVKTAVKYAPKHGVLVDLGSGDGIILKVAAKTGRRVLGIELNPVLVALSKIRLMKYSLHATVKLGDYWQMQLPKDVSAVFVFIAGPYTSKLQKYVLQEASRLGHDFLLISYGFTMPDLPIITMDGPIIVHKVPYSLQVSK